ncbi:MAG: ice-binding family protein [Actinomycetota bacterium]|nr:ice-binding family protein [Actinomycetota bacterium]
MSRKGSVLGALLLVPALALVGVMTERAGAATPTTINLGTTAAASVLAGAGVTNTGPSVLNRDLDTYPNPAITGFPPGTVLGTEHAADAVAMSAQSDLTTAYNQAASAPSTNDVTGVDLSGKTLTQGVYTATSGIAVNGPLALTLNGGPDSVFIFQAGSTLITGSNSSVLLTGGAQACNVFWQVSSSATLGTNTAFVGNILASASITLNTGAMVDGRALAETGSVTLDSNVFTNSGCVTTPPTTTTVPGSTTSVPASTTTIPSSTTTVPRTTTTAPVSTTTTVPRTTTTIPRTTTTIPRTTTTAAATTTTTAPVANVAASGSSGTSTGGPSGSGLSGGGGATLIGGTNGQLAGTGVEVRPLVEMALFLVLAGTAVLMVQSRRRNHRGRA